MNRTYQSIKSSECTLAKLSIRNDSILEIRFKQDDYEVDIKDQLEIMQSVEELTDGGKKPFLILVVPGLYGGITPQARNMEMFDTDAYRNHRAMAIVVHALHQRLLGTLYMTLKKRKPNYPYKLFPNEAEATKWLLSLA